MRRIILNTGLLILRFEEWRLLRYKRRLEKALIETNAELAELDSTLTTK